MNWAKPTNQRGWIGGFVVSGPLNTAEDAKRTIKAAARTNRKADVIFFRLVIRLEEIEMKRFFVSHHNYIYK